MIKWSDVGTFLWWVLYTAIILLSIIAANREYWLLMGASLAGFQIGTMILVCQSIERQVTARSKKLERLISESKGT